MEQSQTSYWDAVHVAADHVLFDASLPQSARSERLRELLFSLAGTIPETWSTATRVALSCRERDIERILDCLLFDLRRSSESSRYLILDSIFQLALSVKHVTIRASTL